MYKRPSFSFILFFALITTSSIPGHLAFAQDVSIDIEASPVLENAQVLSLTGLGINENGNGPVLLSGYLENLTDQKLDNLYFQVTISSSRSGTIVDLIQNSSRPFSLDPYQSVYSTNNDMANEQIPGIEENIRFSGGLTSEGDNLINNLEGSTSLPQDIYSIQVIVFQVTDEGGRKEMASSVVEIGNGAGIESSEVYLKTPGDIVTDGAEITNPYPQFSWEGQANRRYRLIVVESTGQDSPESLIQSAMSSAPTNEGGSLLQFENLDVLVDGDNYQFPSSGAQSLKTGRTYYWRVSTILQLSGDTQVLNSEIWEFKLQGGSTAQDITYSEELEEAIIALLGEDELQRLQERGFSLEEIEYDGQLFTGASAAIKLSEILQKIQDEDLIIGNE